MNFLSFKKIILFISLFTLFLFSPMNLTAQGEGYSSYELFYQEESGDMQIDIFVSPQKISVGQVIFSIKITDTVLKKPIEDLKVDIYATPLFDYEKLYSPGLSSADIPGNYQAKFQIKKSGEWVFDFIIENEEESLIVSEQINIINRNRNSSKFGLGFIAIQFIFLAGIGYIIYSSKKTKKKLSL